MRLSLLAAYLGDRHGFRKCLDQFIEECLAFVK
jgi:hypothetical protein